MKRKSCIALFMTAVLTAGLAACGSTASTASPANTGSASQAATGVSEAADSETAAASSAEEAESAVTGVMVQAENRGFGKEAETITITVSDDVDVSNLTVDDFSLNKCMIDKRTQEEIDMQPTAVEASDGTIVLTVDPFIASSSFHFELTSTDERIHFSYADFKDNIETQNVDCFQVEEITVGDTTLQYQIYIPENADGPLPVVLYNHGGGCTGLEGVLMDDCFASTFATTAYQEAHPCIVVAPFRDKKVGDMNSEGNLEAVKAILDQLVSDGKADGDHLYMTGESMGCMFTAKFVSKYPGFLAAAVLMDGGPMEIDEDAPIEETVDMDLSAPYSNEELQTLAESGTAVALVQGVGDTLSVPIRLATVYKKLLADGMEDTEEVRWVPYNAEKFNELLASVTKIANLDEGTAVDPITGEETWKNGLFHNTSRVACQDQDLVEWMFSK